MSLRHGIIGWLCSALFALNACRANTPVNDTTSVAKGLRFVSHNPGFDTFFADLHEEQLAMLQWPDDERKIRRSLAQDLQITDNGATALVLSERTTALARTLLAQGTALKLDFEGLNAVDEADTSAQMRVNGNLDGENLRFAEAITRAARSELKLLARLNAKEQVFQRLAVRAAVLDAETDRSFVSDFNQQQAVHRNLSDARILIAVMNERRLTLAADSRRIVERLASAVTTNPALGSGNEPPLVTFVKPEPTRERPTPRVTGKVGPAAATPARSVSPKSPSELQDFEP